MNLLMPSFYRSSAIGGFVALNRNTGKTEKTNFETFLNTFGKGEKDQARVEALEKAVFEYSEQYAKERGLSLMRVFASAKENFEPIRSIDAKGLGFYRVVFRIMDREAGKIDVRFRRSVRDVINAIIESIAKGIFGGR